MKKYRLGYTTGVFDLFHIGHLNLLRRAKEQCEYLIVGVSTDELVQEYKKKKPVIPYEERRQIVESLKYVDEVIPQVNRNKMDAYQKLKFDVMFVGDDWKGDPLFEAVEKELNLHGSTVIYLPYTKNTSSTLLTLALRQLAEDSDTER
jgi:glycerol-3-phosphate cytidylyltransferase